MKRKILIVMALGIGTALAYLAVLWFPEITTERILQSAIAVTVLYAILSIGVVEYAARKLSDSKTRYGFRKAVSLLLIVLILVVLLRIWIPNPQALLVAYGVVAAGLAVALQDLVKNLAGSITIFLGGIYQVGNRVEINGIVGDVIDIGLFNTTLLEVRGWIEADQATGRITTVPNGAVLNQPIQNYTRHHSYLWDEIGVVVTPESNWQDAMTLLGEIGHRHTEQFIAGADQSLTRLERYYYVEGHILDPNIYIRTDQDGYGLTLRYVVDAWQRRSTNSDIWTDIIATFDKRPDIEFAPTTYTIADYPTATKPKKTAKAEK